MRRKKQLLGGLVHAIRVSIVIALLMLLPSPRSLQPQSDQVSPPSIELVRRSISAADSISNTADQNNLWNVNDRSGNLIAHVARTLPKAADVIGYRGPSEAMIVLDGDLKIVAVQLINSDDTDEHVREMKQTRPFFDQFRGWTWGEAPDSTDVEAVSGATLTSLAFAKGILRRMGGDRPSLVFPDEIKFDEIESWFDHAEKLQVEHERTIVLGQGDQEIGQVLRTGPLCDSVIGYQGPTELLIKLRRDSDRQAPNGQSGEIRQSSVIIDKIRIRSSFDNEPYVGYCKTEYGFWKLFQGRTINEIAAMDLEAEGVEGVSGATMTSMAVAETLVTALKQFETREQDRAKAKQDSKWSSNVFVSTITQLLRVRPVNADWACFLLLIGIPIARSTGWFRKRWFRRCWLVATIMIIGLWSGNLVSMALLAGWSAEGIAWELAPALAALLFVAVISPPLGKSNPYCNHLCPHGALQQVLRPGAKSRRRWNPPRRLIAVLKYLPGTLLVAAYLMLLVRPHTDLSSWEPFHAYLFRIAPRTAMLFAVLTLLLSAFVPMGFCRYGCPTGRLLDFLRRTANSGKATWPDGVAVVLLLVAVYCTL